MELLKSDGCSPKDRMRKATEKWKESKQQKESKTEEDTSADNE